MKPTRDDTLALKVFERLIMPRLCCDLRRVDRQDAAQSFGDWAGAVFVMMEDPGYVVSHLPSERVGESLMKMFVLCGMPENCREVNLALFRSCFTHTHTHTVLPPTFSSLPHALLSLANSLRIYGDTLRSTKKTPEQPDLPKTSCAPQSLRSYSSPWVARYRQIPHQTTDQVVQRT